MKQLLLGLLCVWTSLTTVRAQADWLVVVRVHGNFYVALDHLPEDISPELLSRLFEYLEVRVVPHADAPLTGSSDHLPVVLRFVAADAVGLFPASAEGYGGTVGLARWACDSAGAVGIGGSTRCSVEPAAEAMGRAANVVIAVIPQSENRNENLGFASHELTHVFGAIDGLRPGNDGDYHPGAVPDVDPSDAYWWYGVTGVFSLQPAGIVWEALMDRCGTSQATGWCMDLRQILVTDI